MGGATGATPSLSTGLCPCRYTGERPTTNMAVIEAKLPSGYIPDKGSVAEVRSLLPLHPAWCRAPVPHRDRGTTTLLLSLCPQLKRQQLVKKVEVQTDQVTIYLDQVRWGRAITSSCKEGAEVAGGGCTSPLCHLPS